MFTSKRYKVALPIIINPESLRYLNNTAKPRSISLEPKFPSNLVPRKGLLKEHLRLEQISALYKERNQPWEYQLNLCTQHPNEHFLFDKLNFVTYQLHSWYFIAFICYEMLWDAGSVLGPTLGTNEQIRILGPKGL